MNRFIVWLYTSSPAFFITLTLVAFIGLGIVGLLVTRPVIRKRLPVSNEVAICMISCASLIYALILGLIAVATWETFNKVDEIAAQEAFSVGSLYRDLAGYPPQQRDALRAKLRRYMQNVIEVEWPLQQCGKSQDGGTITLVDDLVKDWEGIEPPTEGQRVLHAQALAQLNQFLRNRGSRVQAVILGLAPVMWVTVLLGAALNIVLAYFLSIEKPFVHVILVGAYSAMIGLVIAMIISMDKPLLGSTSISPDAYERVLTDVMHAPPLASVQHECR